MKALTLSTPIPDISLEPPQKKGFHVSHTVNGKITTWRIELKPRQVKLNPSTDSKPGLGAVRGKALNAGHTR